MDAVVQLIRNGLCCIKDLNLLPETFLYDPAKINFPNPLHETTPLEFLIGITQFYAFVSISMSGFKILTGGFRKLERMKKVLKVVNQRGDNKSRDESIVLQSVQKALTSSRRDIITGFCVFPIGIAFFWLFANSLHVTSTGWIGGLPALIHALTVMEVGLAILLYYMIIDAMNKWSSSKRMKKLSESLQKSGGWIGKIEGLVVNDQIYDWLLKDGWKPFWLSSDKPEWVDETNLEKLVKKETESVKKTLDFLLKKDGGDDDKLVKAASQAASKRLIERADESWREGWCEYIYFVMNFIAFYGYMLCVVVYYFDRDDEQPSYVYYSKFGMKNMDADWHGNFIGDFMWTLEPVVILGSPFWVKKVKSDAKKAKEE